MVRRKRKVDHDIEDYNVNEPDIVEPVKQSPSKIKKSTGKSPLDSYMEKQQKSKDKKKKLGRRSRAADSEDEDDDEDFNGESDEEDEMDDLEDEEEFDSEEETGKKKKGRKSVTNTASGRRSTRTSGPVIEITAQPIRSTRSRGPPQPEISESDEE